ncbi:MAG: alpha/beta hydrolase [Bacteroidales bacterium]|nr:alpha/beta hydrolase [Bacteroidales bacterium]
MKYLSPILIIAILIWANEPCTAQHSLLHPEVKIDTSYTLGSALAKYQKKYPYLKATNYKPINKIKKHENLIYQSYGSRPMHLDLFEPENSAASPRPCVALVHGGGWSSGDKSLLEPFALALADSGYVIITIEYRLSNEALYPAAVIDIITAIKWLYANALTFNIDTSHISIMGSSAGGQLATLVGVSTALKKFNDPSIYNSHLPKIKSIIDLDGIIAFIHPLSEEGGKPGKKGSAEKWFGIHFKDDPTKWNEASALTYVGKNTPPTLFIASSFPRFNAGREDMIKIMDRYGIYHDKLIFDDAPHSFWLFDPWFEPTLNKIIRFLGVVNSR